MEIAPTKHAPLLLTEEEQSNFYQGFSNEIISPRFHDLQSFCNFEPLFKVLRAASIEQVC